ncbi:MAG: PAS domain S-box protein [Acidobacteriota bacterium]|nr:PAS domain S-box protein [Acidobacteriota bacterium]
MVADFLAGGLLAGEPTIVIATPEHRAGFTASLTAKHLDVNTAIASGQLTLLDAHETLALFMVGNAPDETRFKAVIGAVIAKSSNVWKGALVRAYGEMVDVLWRDGNHDAAIRLEELWNDLAHAHTFSLLCAYPMGNFLKESHSAGFDAVCRTHQEIFPAETEHPAALRAEVEHRKELEKTLREALSARRRAEKELKDFVENAPVGLHWVGADGTILWANQAELDLLGFSRNEYIGHNITDFHADRKVIDNILERLTKGEELHDVEARLRAKDGSIKHVVISSNVLFEEGRFIHTRCFTRDVTDKKRAEGKFQRLMDSNIIAIMTRTADGQILDANDVYLRLTGYDRQDLAAGRFRWTDITPPEYRSRDEAALAEVATSGECALYEKEYIRKDGTRVPIMIAAASLNGGDTQIACAIDLTERKLAERDAKFLAQVSEVLTQTLDSRTVLESVTRLFVPRVCDWAFVDLVQNDGGFDRTSVTFASTTDQPLAARIERSYSGDLLMGRTLPTTTQALVANEVKDEVLAVLAYADGDLETLRAMKIRCLMRIPLIAHGVTHGFITFAGSRAKRTFTDRDLSLAQEIARRAALAIENAMLYEAAQKANRAKDEFLATLSHELRTPLTAIIGWSKFLRISDVDPQTMQNAVDAIHRAANVQAQLIDDVLDMSRIISGKLRLEVQPIQLSAVVEAAVETVRPAIMAKEINLEVDCDPSVGVVWADPNRMQQGIWNLLTNSAKFTDKGGTITVTVRRAGSAMQITVSDTGQGIEPEFLPHVFERFRQAESTSTRAFGGLGLGLAIVRYIVEMHGGRVIANSEGIGKGAQFTIELPIPTV